MECEVEHLRAQQEVRYEADLYWVQRALNGVHRTALVLPAAAGYNVKSASDAVPSPTPHWRTVTGASPAHRVQHQVHFLSEIALLIWSLEAGQSSSVQECIPALSVLFMLYCRAANVAGRGSQAITLPLIETFLAA